MITISLSLTIPISSLKCEKESKTPKGGKKSKQKKKQKLMMKLWKIKIKTTICTVFYELINAIPSNEYKRFWTCVHLLSGGRRIP